MMLGWSIPKWTGYGPWVDIRDRGGKGVMQQVERRGWVGYWGGTKDQRERFEARREEGVGVEGEMGGEAWHLDQVS